jgi:uncharacterized Zn finger protein (UPF0148 family)
MIRRLPVLLQLNNSIYKEIEFKKLETDIIAQTYDTMKNNNYYLAMRVFVAGCTESIKNETDIITDQVAIKSALSKMSHKNLEYFVNEILTNYFDGDDYVEGLYICPLCGQQKYAEKKNDDGIEIDTRDRIQYLKVNFMDDSSDNEFEINFQNSIILKSANTEEEINSIKMRISTLEDVINAYNLVGDRNEFILQLAIYANSLIVVNGIKIEKSWKNSYGLLLFKKINSREILQEISKNMNKYGVNPRIEKHCNKCGKVWQPYLDTTNFFVSALQ